MFAFETNLENYSLLIREKKDEGEHFILLKIFVDFFFSIILVFNSAFFVH